jgi:hypothetical protein
MMRDCILSCVLPVIASGDGQAVQNTNGSPDAERRQRGVSGLGMIGLVDPSAVWVDHILIRIGMRQVPGQDADGVWCTGTA